MKNYRLKQDGKKRKTKKLEVLISEESVKAIMEKMGLGVREAESRLIRHSYGFQENNASYRMYLSELEGRWFLTTGEEDEMEPNDISIEPAIYMFN